MKIIFTLFVLFLSTSSSTFASVPDCWTVDGKETGRNSAGTEITDGRFLILVDAKTSTLDSLVQVMDKVDHGNLRATRYPNVFVDKILFVSQSVDDAVQRQDRDALKLHVHDQIAEIGALPGVGHISCDRNTHSSWNVK